MVGRLSHTRGGETDGEALPLWLAQGRSEALRHLGWLDLCRILAEGLASDMARTSMLAELEAIAALQRGESRESVAERSPGAAAAWARVPALGPEPRVESAKARLAELDGLELLWQEESRIGRSGEVRTGLGQLEDLEPSLRAVKGSTLAVVELIGVAELCRVAGWVAALIRAAQQVADPGPERARGFEALCTRLRDQGVGTDIVGELPELLAELDRAIDRGGEEPRIADRASPALARARKQLRSCKQSLLHEAERLIRSNELGEALRDRYWTEREGRVVLPVRSDALGKVRGPGTIIHGSSGSGHTFFVEPAALVEDNNALREAESAAFEAEFEVRRQLTVAVARHAEEVLGMQQAMLELDRIAARLAFSQRIGGVTPELGSERIELVEARHPLMLLDGVEVVPSDLTLGRGQALVVSGPNAGGKTVALETLGLCALMAAAGIRLPCRRARIPHFTRIITDIGDDQSIAANLSTFSAHIAHVRRAIESAELDGAHTLVLFDEIAAGTDPEQGAALAEAILLSLVEAGASVVVTTHYDRLKLLATRTGEQRGAGRFHNAAVGFDIQRMRPTFRLTIGVPGSSSAIAVARRLGLSESIVAEAESLLGTSDLQIDRLLRDIEDERQSLVRTRERLERERAGLAVRDRQVRDREQRALEGLRSRKANAYAAAVEQLRALELELAEKRKQLRRLGAERVDQVPTRDVLAGEATRVLAETHAADEAERRVGRRPAAPQELIVGARVEVLPLAQVGTIVSVGGKRASVQLPLSRVTVKLAELSLAPAEPSKAKVKPGKARAILDFRAALVRQAARHFGESPAPVSASVDNVCDIRGERFDAAQDRVATFVAKALERDQDIVVIRHGHGSGALRTAVREALRRSANVLELRPGLMEEGGEAVTVAWIE